ncbi:MAG: hypothetical protein LBN39_11420 [Planctomycetaceae bacterium]|jgi:hypothetical protein|nr:hypothetical protein [Planctomycetaceae bacterium]
MVKTKPQTFAESVKAAHRRDAKATKNMNDTQRNAYYDEQTAKGMKRFQAVKDKMPPDDDGNRELQLLIRLTKMEKEILERDASSENAKSVSALVRSRSLRTQSPFDVILGRLDLVVKRLDKIEKFLAGKK